MLTSKSALQTELVTCDLTRTAANHIAAAIRVTQKEPSCVWMQQQHMHRLYVDSLFAWAESAFTVPAQASAALQQRQRADRHLLVLTETQTGKGHLHSACISVRMQA